jgi:hypothetical protein
MTNNMEIEDYIIGICRKTVGNLILYFEYWYQYPVSVTHGGQTFSLIFTSTVDLRKQLGRVHIIYINHTKLILSVV